MAVFVGKENALSYERERDPYKHHTLFESAPIQFHFLTLDF